jgi:hypothetical protein
MTEYLIRYRNLSGPDPMSPQSIRIEAKNGQAAIEDLKKQMSEQELRVEKVSSDTPAPRKRKTRAEWVLLALFLILGGVNLVTRWLG